MAVTILHGVTNDLVQKDLENTTNFPVIEIADDFFLMLRVLSYDIFL